MEGTSRLLGSERGGSSIGSSGMHPRDTLEPAFPGTALPLSGSERLWRGGGEGNAGAVWLMSSSEQSSSCILPRPGACLVLISLSFPHNTEKAQKTKPSGAFSDSHIGIQIPSCQRTDPAVPYQKLGPLVQLVSEVPQFILPCFLSPQSSHPQGQHLMVVCQMSLREIALGGHMVHPSLAVDALCECRDAGLQCF